MPHEVKTLDVWTGEIDDQVGGLASKLEPLASAGADLQFLVARRQPHLPGKGVVFLSGISGAKATKAATAAGLAKASDVVALRVEGPNKPGACHQLTRRLADAGINLRGVSAGVMGKKFLVFLAFDSRDDAATAARLLRAGGKKK
ncbi:MAG: ACT domain-containing protein [Planctomycetes bacterium]|nr:ACT domain-containing protein [Planctomycetota bacterium]